MQPLDLPRRSLVSAVFSSQKGRCVSVAVVVAVVISLPPRLRSAIPPGPTNGLKFPDLNSSPFGGETYQTNLIMPGAMPVSE
jgi:hypothetical protein